MSERRPVIGISALVAEASWGVWRQTAVLLPQIYIAAVQRAGGMPLMLPPDPAVAEDPDELLAQLDGLVLSGGSDVDPACYGAELHPETNGMTPDRDRFELALTRRAMQLDMPLLGICRGMQVLNVALGGTLLQHLPETFGHEHHRRVPGSFDGSDHDVRLEPDSLAASAAGEHLHATKSHHHQGVDTVGAGLTVTGRSTVDDLPEAIEAADQRFVLGVQWHPEADERSRVVDALVSEARAYRRTRLGAAAQPGRATTASISTCAPRGSANTPTATRAGGFDSKNDA